MNKKKRFDQIVKDIKEIKIQGATNIARNALYAYSLFPLKSFKKKLLRSRPTEPMLEKVLTLADRIPSREIQKHFTFAQDQINRYVLSLIHKNDIIFTHCHSTNVVKSLIYSRKKGKKFEVYNTQTSPLFQGKKTAKELTHFGIKVTMFVDSASGIALSKEQGAKKVNLVLLGADAILKTGVINKVGSETITKIAKMEKIPVYIVADSWKFTNKKIEMEQREIDEVWNNAPDRIKIKNPAFEFVKKKYIKGIVSEFGVLSFSRFLKKVQKS